MAKASTSESARERILSTATDLFYRQGYKATGINEVIEKSGVAKATFYSHFPSKDQLCVTYLRQQDGEYLDNLRLFMKKKTTARSKFLAVAEWTEIWLMDTQYRGCAFLNMVAEEPDKNNPMHKEGKRHYEKFRRLLKILTQSLIDSDADKYKHLKADSIAEHYLIILTGAIALCELYHDTWPIKRAIKAARNLIE